MSATTSVSSLPAMSVALLAPTLTQGSAEPPPPLWPLMHQVSPKLAGPHHKPHTQRNSWLPPQRPRPVASETDWNLHKPTIKRLYIDDNLSLHHVMERMRYDYDFHASTKMYKTRMSRWGFTKNIKSSEIQKILHAQSARRKLGKETTVLIRGSKVDHHRLKRYAQRYGISKASEGPTTPEPSIPDGIICRTPSPSPSAGLRASRSVEGIEEVLHHLRTFVEGALDAGRWQFTYNHQFRTGSDADPLDITLTRARRTVNVVTQALENGDTEPAFRILNPLFDKLPKLLRTESPLLIPSLLEIQRSFARHPELAQSLYDYFGHFSQTVLGIHHPLALILNRVRSVEIRTEETLLKLVYTILLDQLIPRVGPGNLLAVRLYIAYIWHSHGIEGFRGTGMPSVVAKYMKDERTGVPYALTKTAFVLNVCNPSLQNGDLADAEQSLISLYENHGLFQALAEYSDIFSSLFLGMLKRAQGRDGEATGWYKKALETSERWSWNHMLAECALGYAESLGLSPKPVNSITSLSAILDPTRRPTDGSRGES